MTDTHVAVYMSNNQAYIQALQWIIGHLQCEIQAIHDIINQLSQVEDPNIILIEVEPIFDSDEPFQFALPPALLHQEVEPNIQEGNLNNASLITVAHAPATPQALTQCECIAEAHRRAREWAAEQYPNQS